MTQQASHDNTEEKNGTGLKEHAIEEAFRGRKLDKTDQTEDLSEQPMNTPDAQDGPITQHNTTEQSLPPTQPMRPVKERKLGETEPTEDPSEQTPMNEKMTAVLNRLKGRLLYFSACSLSGRRLIINPFSERLCAALPCSELLRRLPAGWVQGPLPVALEPH